ncbi:MAG: selenocysteine-specific translation elongation factor [Deltaproteobacteria bacterium]|nr:selenocysteine-specific translation elongation factor [Deltaproteobacteria bacterium]
MKQIILGTAGHIDHGKTSLIKALTGIDTDRLKEEKERGITIELGFAHVALPSGQLLGIVDVPGHEKFVKNMVAGATGIDLVALVIAADEGVMPQTREHLEICQLLGIQYGLIVLTKIDMSEPDWIDLVKEDISEFLSDTFLADAPLVEVSSVTGQGLDELTKVLDDLVQKIPERDVGHFFRLPVDRVFTMKGFGTVVTGTTISGSLSLGDEATVYPQETDYRVRGIQVHNRETDQVRAGLRTAINLQGAEKTQIQRGNVLASKNSLRSTHMVDVLFKLIPSAPRKLKNRAMVRFHAGTAEIMGRIILLDRDELKPGDQCFAQLRLEEPITVLYGDRYILRSYSPVRTIGGGVILNALPLKKRRFTQEVLKELEGLYTGDLQTRVELFIRMGRFQGVESADLQFQTNSGKKGLDDALSRLSAQKRITQYSTDNGSYIHADFFDKAVHEVTSILKSYHEAFPLKTGLVKEELRSKTMGSLNQKLFSFIINRLIQQQVVVQEQEVLRLKDHKVTLAQDQEKIRRTIEETYQKAGLEPPYFKEVRDQFPNDGGKDVLEVMVKEGRLIKVKEDLYFHHGAIDALKDRIVAFLKENEEISTPQFKDMTGVSRKYAIPIMEYFDRTHVTVRVGDNRVLRKK